MSDETLLRWYWQKLRWRCWRPVRKVHCSLSPQFTSFSILSSRLRKQSTVFDLIQPALSWSIAIFLKIWFQSQLWSMTVLSEIYVTNIHSFCPLSAVLCCSCLKILNTILFLHNNNFGMDRCRSHGLSCIFHWR